MLLILRSLYYSAPGPWPAPYWGTMGKSNLP